MTGRPESDGISRSFGNGPYPYDRQARYAAELNNFDGPGNGFDIWEVIDALYEYRGMVIACGVLAILSAVLYLFFTPKIYEADALLQVQNDNSGLAGLPAMQAEQQAAMTAEIEILTSRLVLGDVVRDRSLDIISHASYFPVVGEPIARRAIGQSPGEPPFGPRRYGWGGEMIHVSKLRVPAGWLGQPIIIEKIDGETYSISAGEEKLGEAKPEESAVVPYLNSEIGIKISSIRAKPGTQFVVTKLPLEDAIGRLRDRLAVRVEAEGAQMLRVKLRGAQPGEVEKTLEEIIRIYLKSKNDERVRQSQAALTFLKDQLPAVQADLSAAEDALSRFQRERASVDLTMETRVNLDRIADLEAELLRLRSEREAASQRYLDNHPKMIALSGQYNQAVYSLRKLQREALELPETRQQLVQLKRDVTIKNALYSQMLNRLQEMKVVHNGQATEVRVVDAAVAAPQHISPKNAMTFVLFSTLGGIVALVLTLVRRKLFGGVTDTRRLERFNAPVYAVVPRSYTGKRKKKDTSAELVALNEPSNPAVEGLRNLSVAMRFAVFNATNRVIMVTGPTPGVGKTFVSCNLSVLLAKAGHRVVLIDADLRRGQVHKYFSLDRERSKGLSEAIVQSNSVASPPEWFAQKTEVDNLRVITTGQPPPNPSELLTSGGFAAILDSIDADYIIVDTPPILAVVDALVVGMVAGASLLVTRSGAHSIRDIERCVVKLREADANFRGFVMNDVASLSAKVGYGPNYVYTGGTYDAAPESAVSSDR